MVICSKHEIEKVPRQLDGVLVCRLCRWELLQELQAMLKQIQDQVTKEMETAA